MLVAEELGQHVLRRLKGQRQKGAAERGMLSLVLLSIVSCLSIYVYTLRIKNHAIEVKEVMLPSVLMPAKRNDSNNTKPAEHKNEMKILPESQDSKKKPCALLFFGLVKDFKDLALPAIHRNIIDPNPSCDVFLHTYDIDKVPENKRNKEVSGARIYPSDAYLLTPNVIIESTKSFDQKRGDFLNQTRKYHHGVWGKCCLSHDNMIKQWHSIDAVWKKMRQHEEKLLHQTYSNTHEALLAHKGDNHYYQQIGLFRSDVYHVNKIDIFNSNATIANFGHYNGYNDRLFYGSYDNAAIWANRFGFSSIFEEKYIKSRKKGQRGSYHSETFVKQLMTHHNISIDMQDICVWRIRNGKRLQVTDCGKRKYERYNGLHGYKYAPEGYIVDKQPERGKMWAAHWSSVWDDPVQNIEKTHDPLKMLDKPNLEAGDSISKRPGGVVLLGMIQSGTSLLTEFLAQGYGFHLGNLDTNSTDFDLASMKRQNDAFLWGQGLTSNASNVDMYNHEQTWSRMQNHTLPTACGAVALKKLVLSVEKNANFQWMVNDPRLCITLQTWLPMFKSKPVVIYTYHDPLEVALLLEKEHGFELGKGLLLWILYNKSAIQNSARETGMCRIVTTKQALTSSPLTEMDRIIGELTECGITSTFPSKKHNQGTFNSVLEKYRTSMMGDMGNSTSDQIYELKSRFNVSNESGDVVSSLYSKATKVQYDLKSGVAFGEDYVWPKITRVERGTLLDEDREAIGIERDLREQYHHCSQ